MNGFYQATKISILLTVMILLGCKNQYNDSSPKPTEKVMAKVRLGGLGLSTSVCLRLGYAAKVEWRNEKKDSSFLLFIPAITLEKGSPKISGILFQKVQDNWVVIADNLSKNKLIDKDHDIEFFEKNRARNIDVQIDGEIVMSNDVARLRLCNNSENCCTVSCSNGTTMKCCNACCSDPANGCAECCAQ